MVRRDRNHPSVIMWSIGNEIREQNAPEGWKVAASMAAIVRSEDRTRLTAAGFNHIASGYNGFQTAMVLAIVRTRSDQAGQIVVSASSDGLTGAKVVLGSTP